ncbi:hypothetical protein DesyoDRAFT_3804 [Desulfosporosinus youngiae DSM 17734]|uniref:Uncharacterized protein n=1 Tax=Desulfosporosinus youngiae DSM 17734 TaxID=768710 RepID=H5Y5R3_9FIRM|nr:hypothetical protein DesyoDRAFT_3804 [Desulfosporosinus youngiae DSM 17734]
MDDYTKGIQQEFANNDIGRNNSDIEIFYRIEEVKAIICINLLDFVLLKGISLP